LARFQTRSTSSPLHWFALAAEFGLRDELELACLREGLSLLTQRPRGTLLSVNLTGALLTDPRTRELLSSQPTLTGLIIEVTENSLVQDTPELHAAISELISDGVRFAVDDVGCGYSGLRQMTIVHPTYLKLDRSLVNGIDQDPGRGALLSALAGYAVQTGGYVVAEGVETKSELSTLVSLGITLAQGFYLARPGPPWPVLGSDVAGASALAEDSRVRLAPIGGRIGPGLPSGAQQENLARHRSLGEMEQPVKD
jgi:EAL domain-containing protein (putative c-di-GMP-specific phosphodiesterase class I)